MRQICQRLFLQRVLIYNQRETMKDYNFKNLNNLLRSNVLVIVFALFLVSGCATTSTPIADEPALEVSEIEPSAETEELVVAKEPPNMALDAELLEQLMISNFASYAGDWDKAVSSALSAAQISQDFRLARLASILALRDESYAEVAAASELWYELDAENEDAYNTLVIGLVGSGKVEEAIIQFDQRFAEIQAQASETVNSDLATDGYDANAPLDVHVRQIAGLLVRQGNSEAALAVVEHYVESEPDSAQVLLSSSYVANYFEEIEIAEEWLSKTLELRPNWDVAAQMYSNMLASQDRNEERLAYIRLYIEDNPTSVPIRIQYAAELARLEDYQGSLDIMQTVITDDPENSDAILYTAAISQQLDQTELTEQLYEQVLTLEPNNNRALWALGVLAADQEEYRKAEAYYERIGRGENYFSAQIQIANMRYETRGLTSAINYLRLIDPRTEGEYIQISLTRHYLLLQDNEYEDAFGYINDSLVYLPDNVDMLYARALVAAELKQMTVVESDLRSIISRFPDHSNALNALGYTLADQTDRYQEAEELIARALELEPDEGHILDSMGWVLYRQGDYEGAIEHLKRAFEVMPEVEVATHLGEVYWENGQQQEAHDIWAKAYALDAGNKLLLETLERYGQQELYASNQVTSE